MRSFSFLLLALLTACASSGTTESVRPVAETIRLNGGAAGSLTINPSSSTAYHTLPYAVDQVWRVLPTVLESMGMTIGVLDPATHEAGNAGYKLRRQLGGVPLSRYFNCGETQIGPNADSYDIYLSALARLTAAPDGTTTISTTMDAAARPVAFSQDYTRCTTRGELESRVLSAIRKALEK